MADHLCATPIDRADFLSNSIGVNFYKIIKEMNPDRICMIDDDSQEEINYRRLQELSIKLACKLQSIGIKKGDVVTVISENSWKYLVTIIGGWFVGARINLLNPDYTTGEFECFFKICCPTIIFCNSKVSRILPGSNIKIVTLDTNFDNFIRNSENTLTPLETNIHELAILLTSSGTTGVPKIVPLTHNNFQTTLLNFNAPDILGLDKNETFLVFLPMFHILGIVVSLSTLLFGTKSIIIKKFNPERFLRIIQEHKVGKLVGVPSILEFLVKSPLVTKYDISSLTDMICGATPLSRELEEMAEQKLNITSRQGYGTTEAGFITLVSKKFKKYGSVGQALPTVQIKVCNSDGKILKSHEIGEMRIKSDSAFTGYIGSSLKHEEVFDDDGFYKSGDLGYYDEDNFFYIVDRLKDVIKYKGFQVSPVELEHLLIRHEGVKDVGVIGVPDERAGEVPLAFVVKACDEVTEEELVKYVEENISVQKRLYGGVRFIQEIPKSQSGKILKKNLREIYKQM